MEKRAIQHISVGTVAKNLWLVFLALGLIVGIGSYIYLRVNPAALAPRIGFWEWVLAIGLYALIFCVILTALSVLAVVFYNMLSKKFGGIAVKIEPKQENNQIKQ